MQIDAWERGFSYSFDAPLDMRMDPREELSAAEIVNEWPESRLAEIIRNYGDERRARSVARQIVDRRPIERTSELVEAIKAGLPPAERFGRGNPAKRTFQAIRIAVNGELDAIDAALPAAWELLAPGGRLAAISFHSHEDRRVKRYIDDLARGCVCPPEFPVCTCGHEPEGELLTRGGVTPSAGEVSDNPRASSARLRAVREARPRRRILMGAPAASVRTRAGPHGAGSPRLDALEARPQHRRAPPLPPGKQGAGSAVPRRAPARRSQVDAARRASIRLPAHRRRRHRRRGRRHRRLAASSSA